MKIIDFDYIKQHLPYRPDDAHKGTMGTLCSVTGSYGYAGAAILSARAALRCGVGLLYQVLPRGIYPLFSPAVPEAVCVPVAENAAGTLSASAAAGILNQLSRATAVLIGCGMGNCADTREILTTVLRHSTCPVVIDADGINALAENIHLLEERRGEVILTPHVKEFSRLSGLTVGEILSAPERAAAQFAARHSGVILALKGHRTYIVRDGEGYLNIAGNSGMAKGGSGDVLAGVIASLAAQGVDPFAAAIMGVHIHALGGDIAAAKLSRAAMLPSDIISALPEIFIKAEGANTDR